MREAPPDYPAPRVCRRTIQGRKGAVAAPQAPSPFSRVRFRLHSERALPPLPVRAAALAPQRVATLVARFRDGIPLVPSRTRLRVGDLQPRFAPWLPCGWREPSPTP